MRADVMRMGIECGPDGCRGFGNAVGVGSFATSLLVLAGLLVVVYIAIFLAMELAAGLARLRSASGPARVDVPPVLGRGLRWTQDAPAGPAWVDQGNVGTVGKVGTVGAIGTGEASA